MLFIMCACRVVWLWAATLLLLGSAAHAQNTSWHGWHEHQGKPPAITADTWTRLDRLVQDGYHAERNGNFQAAYARFSEALGLAKPDKDAHDFCRYRLARACRLLGKNEEARALVDVLIGSGPPPTVAPNDWYRALFLIQDAEEARYLFRFKEALRLWEQADALVKNHPPTRVWTLHNIAYFNRRMGRWQASLEPCRERERLLRQLSRLQEATEAVEWQGIALLHMGQTRDGFAKTEEARAFWRESDGQRYAHSLFNTANALRAEGPSDQAEALEQEGQNLTRQWSSAANRDFLLNRGRAFLRQGRDDLALEAFHSVADEPQAQSDPNLITPAYDTLADLYRRMGNRDKAYQYVALAHKARLLIRPHDPYFAVISHQMSVMNVALTFADWPLFENAVGVLRTQFHQMFHSPNGNERLGASFVYPAFLRSVAQARALQNRRNEAVQAFSHAAHLYDQAGYDYEQAQTRMEWGDFLQRTGQFVPALLQYHQAEQLLETASVPDIGTDIPLLRVRILTRKADVLRQIQQFEQAQSVYTRVLETVEQFVRDTGDGEVQTLAQSFLLTREPIGEPVSPIAISHPVASRFPVSPYNGLADVVRQNSTLGQHRAWQALLWVERGRAQGLARRVAESEALRARLLPPEEAVLLEKSRQNTLGKIAEQTRQAVFAPLHERARRIAQAQSTPNSDYAQVKRRLSAQYPQFARVCTSTLR